MKRFSHARFLVIFVLLSLLLVGCVDIRVVTTVGSDGSGKWQLGFHIDESLEGFMAEDSEADAESDGTGSLEMPWDLTDGPQTDESSGITFSSENVVTNGQQWTYLTADIPDIDTWTELPFAFARFSPEESEDAEAEAVDADDLAEAQGLFPAVTIDEDLLKKTVQVQFNGLSPAVMFASEAEEAQEGTSEEADLGIDFDPASAINLVYEIRLPGTLESHNGVIDTATHNPVWVIDLHDTTPLHLEAESTTTNWTPIAILLGALLAIVIGGLAGFALIRKGRKSPAHELRSS